MGPRAFNRVCASIRINRDYDVVSVRINAHGVTKRAWAFNCETTVHIHSSTYVYNKFVQRLLLMTIVESGWNVWVWLVGVVSRRRVCLLGVGGIYGCGYWVWL